MSNEPVHILSLGAGVQSSTLALMAAAGEITPMPTVAIFADTQGEPATVYKWLDWLETQLPFPVQRVTKGNLRDDSLKVRRSGLSGRLYIKGLIPAFLLSADGSVGMMGRKCTGDYKVEMLIRAARGWCDWHRGEKRSLVRMWIGISRDEVIRMKPSRTPFIENTWPLVEKGMTRTDCLAWMKAHGYPEPPRSACTFCPFHSDEEWKRIKDGNSDEWQAVIDYEHRLIAAAASQDAMRGTPYLHSSCKPIESVDFGGAPSHTQLSMFGNECEGLCGV